MKHTDYLKKKKNREIRRRIISILSAIVVFVATYALVLPALTLDVKTARMEPGMSVQQEADPEAVSAPEAPAEEETVEESTKEEEPAEAEEPEKEEKSADEKAGEQAPAEEASNEKADEAVQKTEAEQIESADAAASSKDSSSNNDAADQSVDQSGTEESEAAAAEAENAAADAFRIPELEAVNFDTILTDKTDFYYYHEEISEEEGSEDASKKAAVSSTDVQDWKKVKEDTILAPEDFVRVYLAYTIPAGALNETNTVARYRIPEGLELTDKQIKAINENENGISGTDKKADNYDKYLGAEAIEGTRTPDKILKEGTEEYISATVKAEKVYDEDENYLGQDLIFTFVPYTVQKNQIAYDENGKAKSEGKAVKGWFSFDLVASRIDFKEIKADDDSEDSGELVKSQAKITFVKENKKKDIEEISRVLTMAGLSDKEKEQESKTLEYKNPDAGYNVTITYKADAEIPDNAELSVREIEKDTDEYASYLEQAQGAVDQDKSVSDARFFDITILVDGEEFEPKAAVSVQINFTGIEQASTEDTQLLHYTEEEVQVMDKAEFSKSEDENAEKAEEDKPVDTVQFEADGFSVYGIVSTETITTRVITSKGETYEISVTYGPEAEIPKDAKLYATEITDEEKFNTYLDQAAQAVMEQTGQDNLISGRFFDIEIRNDKDIIEPKAPVTVKIQYVDPVYLNEGDELSAIHFGNENIDLTAVEPVMTESGQTEVVFKQDGFSVTGTIVTSGNITNGDYCILYRDGENYYALPNDGTAGVAVTVLDGVIDKPAANIIWTKNSNVWKGNQNNGSYLSPGNSTYKSNSSTNVTLNAVGDGTYKFSRTTVTWNPTTYYLRYSNNAFTGGTSDTNNAFYLARVESSIDVHYGYLDDSGNFVEWEDRLIRNLENPVREGDQHNVRVDISGYDYVTTRLGSATGTDIFNLLQTEDTGHNYWKYRELTTDNEFHTWSQGDKAYDYNADTQLKEDVYVIYRETKMASDGVTPPDDDPQDIHAPIIDKEKQDNEDGTYDIDLSVTGEAASSSQSAHANVVVVLDTSDSMKGIVDGKTKWELTTEAVKDLSTQLLGLNTTSSDNKKVEFAFVNFSNYVKNEKWIYSVGDENKNEYIYSEANRFNTMIDSLDREVYGGGTCWDKAMAAANSILWDDSDPVYVIFISDGDTNSRAFANGVYDYWDGGTYCNTYNGTYPTDYENPNHIEVKYNVDSTTGFADLIKSKGGILYTIGIDGGGNIANLHRLHQGSVGYVDDPEEEGFHFNATDSAKLTEAFESIMNDIFSAVGYQDIEMTDGLTGMTSTALVDGTAGNFSYTVAKYQVTTEKLDALPEGAEIRSKKDEDGNITAYSRNDDGTYTKTVKTVVPDTKATVTKNNDGTLSVLFPGETIPDIVAQAEYDEVTKQITWNLGDDYQLRDGYTYTVTFTVWPNQVSYDIIAALRNGLLNWDEQESYKYIDEDGHEQTLPYTEYSRQIVKSGDSYSLRSNVESGNIVKYYKVTTKTLKDEPSELSDEQKATLNNGGEVTITEYDPEDPDKVAKITIYVKNSNGTYTRTEKVPGSANFINPDPMPLEGTTVSMTKEWDDSLDPSHLIQLIEEAGFFDEEKTKPKYYVELNVLQGKTPYKSYEFYPVKENGKYVWPAQTVNIAPALLVSELPVGADASDYKTVTLEGKLYYVLNDGHTYNITETDTDYHFEFHADPYHPALIDTELTNVVFETDDDGAIMDGSTATVRGDVPLETFEARNSLTSELDITKIVRDETNTMTTAEMDAETFTYKVKLTIPYTAPKEAEEGEEEGETEEESKQPINYAKYMNAFEWVARYNDSIEAPNRYVIHGYQSSDSDKGFEDDVSRINEKVYGRYTVSYPGGAATLDEIFTPDQEGDGTQTGSIYITMKRNEVIRFTNLPYGTEYTIEEVYANLKHADPSWDAEAVPAEGDPDSNLANQGYTSVSVKTKHGNDVSPEQETRRVEGKITALNSRFYNQFTNVRTAVSNDVRAELKVKKAVDGYEWNTEFYRFNLAAGTAEYSDTEGGKGISPMPSNSRVDIYKTTPEHTLSFGDILYTRPGTYTYTLSENDNSRNLPYIQFADPVTITVVITEGTDGKLQVSNISDEDGNTITTESSDTALIAGVTTVTNVSKGINLKKIDSNTSLVVKGAKFELQLGREKQYFSAANQILTAQKVLEIINESAASGSEFSDLTSDEAKAAMTAKGINSELDLGETDLKGFQVSTISDDPDKDVRFVYQLKETAPPPGYIITNDNISYFIVVRDAENSTNLVVRLTDANGQLLLDDDQNPILVNGNAIVTGDSLAVSIKNESGAELPHSGGPGTFLYTLSGIALICVSALMYGFRMRRRERRLK